MAPHDVDAVSVPAPVHSPDGLDGQTGVVDLVFANRHGSVRDRAFRPFSRNFGMQEMEG